MLFLHVVGAIATFVGVGAWFFGSWLCAVLGGWRK